MKNPSVLLCILIPIIAGLSRNYKRYKDNQVTKRHLIVRTGITVSLAALGIFLLLLP